MHRAWAAAVIVVVVLASACSSGGEVRDEVGGDCEVAPRVVCRNQDLSSVSLVAATLQGVDFSGSNLSSADLRRADLTGAKLVGATLASTNFANASLKDADLTRAFMFGTNLTDADLSGAITTGVERCNVIEPDGSLTVGFCAGADAAPVEDAPSTEPPTIEYFRPARPERCVNDASGTGIDIEWLIRDANTLTFYVDGIRIEASSKRRGTKRVPFECDGRNHIVSVRAFGVNATSEGADFTISLNPTAPVSADD